MITAILLLTAIGFVLVLVGMERLGALLQRRSAAAGISEADDKRVGQVVTSIFGLLALLLGFTFNLALTRFERRSSDVVAEANAIGSAYQHAALLDAPAQAALQSALRSYAGIRLRYGEAGRADLEPLLAASVRARQQVNAASLAAAKPIANTPLGSATMNGAELIGDVGVQREATLQARLPAAVFAVLLGFICVAVGIMGYAYPPSGNRRGASVLLFILLAVTLLLIIDLDRPSGGSIVINQGAMRDLVTELQSGDQQSVSEAALQPQ